MVQLLLSNQYRQSHPEEGHRREEDSPFSKSPAFMSQNQRPQDSLLHSLGRSHSRFPSSVNAGQMLTPISPSMPGVQMTLLLSSLWYLNRTFISATRSSMLGWLWKWHHGSWICWTESGNVLWMYDMYDTYKSGWQTLQRLESPGLVKFWQHVKILVQFSFLKKASMESWHSYHLGRTRSTYWLEDAEA